MVSYLTAGLAGGVIGALVTKPQSRDMLDRFYAELNTPVEKDESGEGDSMEE